MTATILFDTAGHVARLTLNKPERHNALGADELTSIQSHLETLEHDPELRVLVVTGTEGLVGSAG